MENYTKKMFSMAKDIELDEYYEYLLNDVIGPIIRPLITTNYPSLKNTILS